MLRPGSVFVSLVLAGLVVACSAADIEGAPLEGEAAPSRGTTGQNNTGAAQCVPKGEAGEALGPTDPATFPKCASCTDGSARCIPKNRLPASFAAQLAECSEGGPGLCVPDALVASGGKTPPSCKSLGGKDGVCLSLCLPQVQQNKALLPQDTCAPDEKCTPCLNPLENNAPTGACEIGKAVAATQECEETTSGGAPPAGSGGPGGTGSGTCPHVGPPVIDPATFPACGADAHCAPTAAVPQTMQAQLKACPTGLCVPDKFIASGGNFIPKSCDSVGGAEGRCLNVNIPQVDSQKARLPQGACDASEKCVPCFDPLDGKETGSCKLSCDPGPQKPKTTFKGCCDADNGAPGRAKCVPETLVSEAQKASLGDDDGVCAAGNLCVPNEMLTNPAYKGTPCQVNRLLLPSYTGVCLSDCLELPLEGLVVVKGNCQDGMRCAPCSNPINGQPTGAPGCPGT